MTSDASGLESKRHHPLLVALLAAIPYIVLSTQLNIWVDEAYSLATTGDGVVDAIRTAAFQRQAPLYFVLLSVVRLLSRSIFAARLLSVAAAGGFIWLAGVYVSEVSGSNDRWWVALLVALHPFTVWAATEIRVYALALLLVTAMLLVDRRQAAAEQRPSWWRLVLTGGLWAVGLYTHYFIGFLLAGLVISSIVVDRKKNLVPALVKSAVCLTLFAPHVPALLAYTSAADSQMVSPDPVLALQMVYGHVKWFLLPVITYPKGTVGTILGMVTLAALAGWCVVKRDRLDAEHLRLLILLAVAGALYIAGILIMGPQAAYPRHHYVLFPLVFFAAMALLRLFSPGPAGRAARTVAVAIVAASFLAATVVEFAPLAKEGDYRRIARRIEATEREGEPILLFNAEAVLPFEYYYTGPNELVPVPWRPPLDMYDPSNFTIPDRETIARLMDSLPESHTRLRLVDLQVTGWGTVSYNRSYLDDYLNDNYVRVNETHFFETTLVEFVRRE